MKEKDETLQALQEAKVKALKALRSEPSTYHIEVIDNTALPERLKDKKKISFTIKVPTLGVLSQIAQVIESLPPELFSGDTAMTKQAMENVPAIRKMLAILAHGNPQKKIPSWYEPFLGDNLTLEESLMLWQEAALKIQTDFFLPFFQGAKMMNPMGMNLPQDLIPLHLSEEP